jgi:hypothetical protein
MTGLAWFFDFFLSRRPRVGLRMIVSYEGIISRVTFANLWYTQHVTLKSRFGKKFRRDFCHSRVVFGRIPRYFDQLATKILDELDQKTSVVACESGSTTCSCKFENLE